MNQHGRSSASKGTARAGLACVALWLSIAACNLPLGTGRISRDDGGDGLQTVGGGSIEAGSQQTGEINSLFEAHNWSFRGEEGQVVTIWAKGEGAANPRIKLIDPDGTVIARDNDGGGGPRGTDASITATLPGNGRYTIRVDMFEIGGYALILE